MMSATDRSERNEQTNSGVKPKSESESSASEKSEEYLNFEKHMKAILSIPANEAEEIRRRTPFERKGGK